MAEYQNTDDELLLQKQVLEIVKVSRVTLWQWVREGNFPAPIRLGRGQRSLRWRQSVIQAFIQSRENLNTASIIAD